VLGGAIGAVSWKMLRTTDDQVAAPPQPVVVPTVTSRQTFVRPDWITSDVPSSGYCHDLINRLMCVGVSSYQATRNDGVSEATDVALEELVTAVGLKISDPQFRDTIVPAYNAVRTKALSALEESSLGRTANPKAAAAYTEANDVVRKVRARVVSVLRATGGGAVPAQRSDWYWEEYATETGAATEFLVFIRFDVSLDAVRTLVDKYSSSTAVAGISATTAFPELAWLRATFAGGAIVTKLTDRLAHAGLAQGQIVLAVDDHAVTDASGLARRVEEAHGADVKLTVAAGDAPPKVIAVKP
jgi:hypothetical protein